MHRQVAVLVSSLMWPRLRRNQDRLCVYSDTTFGMEHVSNNHPVSVDPWLVSCRTMNSPFLRFGTLGLHPSNFVGFVSNKWEKFPETKHFYASGLGRHLIAEAKS